MPSPKPVPHAVTEYIRLSDSVRHHVRRAHTVAELLALYPDKDVVTYLGSSGRSMKSGYGAARRGRRHGRTMGCCFILHE